MLLMIHLMPVADGQRPTHPGLARLLAQPRVQLGAGLSPENRTSESKPLWVTGFKLFQVILVLANRSEKMRTCDKFVMFAHLNIPHSCHGWVIIGARFQEHVQGSMSSLHVDLIQNKCASCMIANTN